MGLARGRSGGGGRQFCRKFNRRKNGERATKEMREREREREAKTAAAAVFSLPGTIWDGRERVERAERSDDIFMMTRHLLRDCRFSRSAYLF